MGGFGDAAPAQGAVVRPRHQLHGARGVEQDGEVSRAVEPNNFATAPSFKEVSPIFT